MKILDLIKEWLYMMFLTVMIFLIPCMAIDAHYLITTERTDSPKIIYVYPETYKEDRQLLLELKKNMVQHAKETHDQNDRISTIEENLINRLIPIEEQSRKRVRIIK